MELRLNIKKIKLIIVAATNFRTNSEDIDLVNSFCLLGLTVNCEGISNQEILAFGKAVMKVLEKILRCFDTSMPEELGS